MTATVLTQSRTLSSAELGQLYRKEGSAGLNIVDVRTPSEYREKHIEGSTLLPLDSLNEKNAGELNRDPTEPIYILCHSINRSKICVEKMHGFGIDNVVLVEGGIMAWEKENLPLNRGDKTMSIERQVRIAAGSLILSGSLLAWLIHPTWVILPGFVGSGLIFAGVSDTCGMGLVLARMPWNR